ncbi:MAG TPA: gliding motility-associated C-terminal domain-containing protein, partial [Chryseosolibacter sp.]|nr:gliding motility-associated C-terminal domain-containing protein [Chryseosolibacter sp.]
IEDRHVDPTVSFTFAPNSSCDLTDPNGQIIATAIERDGSTDNYTFGWTLNGAAVAAPIIQTDATPTSQLDNAFEGQYAIVVTNTLTGCDFSAGQVINLDHNISLPNIITVDTFDPLDCLNSGSAEVTAISIGGGAPIVGPTLGTDFQFEWYETDFDPTAQMPTTTPLLAGINAGRYFVRVQDLTTDCKSSPTEVVILPDDIVYPVVTIDQTALQVRCTSDQGTAELVAYGDGNTGVPYQFSWFNNLDTSGPAFSNTSTISNLIHGEYSVLVTNNTTGCSASEIYVVRDDSDRYLPAVALNTEARIDCVNPDGALLAREVGYDPNDLGYPYPSANYSAEWYPGANADVSVAGTAMVNVTGFTRNWREASLDVGDYTVKVTDNNTGCITTSVATVADGRVLPVVAIVEDNPLINCDPARPNGQLSATADGGKVGGYLFDWYNGATVSGAVLTTNNKLIGIGMGDYTVRVTNDFTNCAADATASITDGRLTPPTPTAELVFDRTRCDYPDGWVKAHVGGITFNYSFDWYDGSAVKTSPDFNGIHYKNRDIGYYTVTAMDEVTGCLSLPTSVEVKDLRVIPEVLIHTTPSFCEELPGSVGGTGTAEVQLVPANVVTDDVYWSFQPDGTTIGIGSYITDVLPGFYQADVVTSQGCEATGVGEVKTEVFSYNLVSTNGDNKNDNFRIDCITQFPNNNVKIFNRAGVLVYEADGYDNNDVVFRGIGEKGLYTIGNELPVGTYFYVIDKRDGSKPKTGYLELVR